MHRLLVALFDPPMIAFVVDIGGRSERRSERWLHDRHCAVVAGHGSTNQAEPRHDRRGIVDRQDSTCWGNQRKDDSSE